MPVPENQTQYPVIIRRIINEYSEAYRHRSQLHFKMGNLPGNNQPDNVALRKDLFSQIRELSARMEQLYQQKRIISSIKFCPMQIIMAAR